MPDTMLNIMNKLMKKTQYLALCNLVSVIKERWVKWQANFNRMMFSDKKMKRRVPWKYIRTSKLG